MAKNTKYILNDDLKVDFETLVQKYCLFVVEEQEWAKNGSGLKSQYRLHLTPVHHFKINKSDYNKAVKLGAKEKLIGLSGLKRAEEEFKKTYEATCLNNRKKYAEIIKDLNLDDESYIDAFKICIDVLRTVNYEAKKYTCKSSKNRCFEVVEIGKDICEECQMGLIKG